MSKTTEAPTRLSTNETDVPVTETVQRIVLDRLKDLDKQPKSPWPEAKRRILRRPLPR